MNPALIAALYTAQQLLDAVMLVQQGLLPQEEFNDRVQALGVDIEAAEKAWKEAVGDPGQAGRQA